MAAKPKTKVSATPSRPIKARHEAAGSMAGYLFQIERALYHLAEAVSNSTTIGVETLDDVVVFDGESVRIREQDKHSLGTASLSSQSRALWRTLSIWLSDSRRAEAYFLVTTRAVSSPLLSSLLSTSTVRPSPFTLVRSLQQAAKKIKDPDVASIAADVLSHPAELRVVLGRVRIHIVETHDELMWSSIAARLALRDDVDQAAILDQLFGWVSRQLLKKWRSGAPAFLLRRDLVMLCRKAEARLVRTRIVPRSGAVVPVTAADVEAARVRHFVDHLELVKADEDDLNQAIRHFIQFNIERHRLTDIGDIPDVAWAEREYRLTERWRNVAKRIAREAKRELPIRTGLRILAETTYEHKENLDGQSCDELYMTSGHYHRLADDDGVWWHPHFKSKRRR